MTSLTNAQVHFLGYMFLAPREDGFVKVSMREKCNCPFYGSIGFSDKSTGKSCVFAGAAEFW